MCRPMLRRALSVIPLLVIAACVAASVFALPNGRNDDAIEESLARAAGDAHDEGRARLDWRPLSFLAYDRLYVFGNAATDEGVHARLGFPWPEGRRAIPPDAADVVLVLTAGRHVVAWRRLHRTPVDFGCLAALRSLRRREALLEVRRGRGGSLFAVPAKPVAGVRQARRIARCAASHGESSGSG